MVKRYSYSAVADQRGSTLPEYVLILSLIAFVILPIATFSGQSAAATFWQVRTAMGPSEDLQFLSGGTNGTQPPGDDPKDPLDPTLTEDPTGTGD